MAINFFYNVKVSVPVRTKGLRLEKSNLARSLLDNWGGTYFYIRVLDLHN